MSGDTDSAGEGDGYVEFDQSQAGNVFYERESAEIEIRSSADSVHWEVVDYWESTVETGTIDDPPVTLALPADDPGHYQLRVTASEGGLEATTTFAVLPEFDVEDVDDSRFGVATHFGKLDSTWEVPLMDLVARAGIKWIRDELYWHTVEPDAGTYEFPAKYDEYVQRADDLGLRTLVILSYVNEHYDGGATPYTEEGYTGFAEYGAAVLDEYGEFVDTIEVYNEFNNVFGSKGDGEANSQPEYYADLLETTFDHLRDAHPETTVGGGVTQNVPLDWLDTVLVRGGHEHMDVLSVHPYGVNPETLDVTVRELKSLLEAHDGAADLPVWISELGWATNDDVPQVEESNWDGRSQARFLVKSQAAAFANGIEKFVWYDFMDDGLDDQDREHNFGLVRNTEHRNPHTPKPSYVAFATLIRQLTGTEFVREETVEGPVTTYVFEGDRERRVAWASEPWRVTLETDDEPVTVTDIVGTKRTKTADGSAPIELRLDPSPRYLTGSVNSVTSLGPVRMD